MKMYTRRADQGQAVEVSYGFAGGQAVERVHDRSDRTTTWYLGEVDWDREPEHEDTDHVPCIRGDWREVPESTIDSMQDA